MIPAKSVTKKSYEEIPLKKEKFTINELQEEFSSASAIRNEIMNNEEFNLEGQVPEETLDLFKENYQIRYPVYANDFSLLLKFRLLNETKESLTQYADVSEELANRIIRNKPYFKKEKSINRSRWGRVFNRNNYFFIVNINFLCKSY